MSITIDNERFLGVDIGGTNVKMGLVDKSGTIHDFNTHPSADWRNTGQFTNKLMDAIAFKLVSDEEFKVERVGIGIPGLLDKERKTPLEVPAIPELNGVHLYNVLKKRFPKIHFTIENDANAAALGEFYFGSEETGNDFIFCTLGTGVGGAAVIDKELFHGADGNSMEFGHIVSWGNKRLEQNIGKKGILSMAAELYAKYEGKTKLSKEEIGSASKMIVAAGEGDPLACEVYYRVGVILGEGLVAPVRILDCKEIIIGGGLSASFALITEGIEESFKNYLTPYYLEKISIKRATLGNDAGILGAASLCFL